MNRFINGNKFNYKRWVDKVQGIIWEVRGMKLSNKQIQAKNRFSKED